MSLILVVYIGTLLQQVYIYTIIIVHTMDMIKYVYIGGNGNWSTDGCNTSVFINDSLSSITCHCDHLTNFACLVVSCIL